MIPTISDTELKDDYIYEDDNEIRIIHGLRNAFIYAHPSLKKEIGTKIKNKSLLK